MDHWPWDLLTPRQERWWLSGVTMSGGTAVAGTVRPGKTDGGGLWVGEQSFLLSTREQIKAARAIEANLDGGVGKIVAWSFEEPFAPGDLVVSSVRHSDGAPFGDGSLYGSVPAGATTTADCALRSARIPLAMLSGELQGGEHFSVIHATYGWRRYRVARVGDGYADIRPPLREAIPAGTALYFIRVGLSVRLANPEEFFGALDPSRIVEVTARWVEAF
ncbi:hypothetical protein ACFPIF_00120 [Brevundimonas faecalis]|uniref:hypothetical protein n=1 Tax=Brevundimonas faecalis TaxID=947378 RepID=UPI00360ABE5C